MTQRHWMYDMRVKLKYCLIMMRRGGLNGCSCRTEKRTFALLDNGTAGLSSQWITVRQRDFRVQISHNSLCHLGSLQRVRVVDACGRECRLESAGLSPATLLKSRVQRQVPRARFGTHVH
jgi:hypothetical protein